MKKILKTIMLIVLCLPFSVSALETIKTNYDNLLSKVNTLDNNLFLNSHPVGSIYMTTKSDENTAAKVASKYGGTWEVYASGRTLMGYNGSNAKFSTIGGTGGSATTTLTKTNLPSHNHTISHTHGTPATTITSSGAHTHTTASNSVSLASLSLASAGSHTHSYSEGGKIIIVGSNSTFLSYSSGFQGSNSSSSFWYGANKSNASISSAGSHAHTVTGSITIPSLSISSSGAHTHTVPKMTTSSQSTTASGSTGASSASINVMNPYIVTYIYKRVS